MDYKSMTEEAIVDLLFRPATTDPLGLTKNPEEGTRVTLADTFNISEEQYACIDLVGDTLSGMHSGDKTQVDPYDYLKEVINQVDLEAGDMYYSRPLVARIFGTMAIRALRKEGLFEDNPALIAAIGYSSFMFYEATKRLSYKLLKPLSDIRDRNPEVFDDRFKGKLKNTELLGLGAHNPEAAKERMAEFFHPELLKFMDENPENEMQSLMNKLGRSI